MSRARRAPDTGARAAARSALGRGPATLLLLLIAAAAAFGLVSSSTPSAQAAVASDFRAGNIIADAVFFNSNTMSAANIQGFLEGKVPRCSGGTCLRDYYQDTWTRTADAQCGVYQGAAGERASTILYKVAQACGVNPMVLLVLLQKESSLVTSTAPSSTNYRSATGYGCPDTAPCDAQYYGFYNQVYKAAWQYKRYTNNPNSYSYRAGRDNYIQWSPTASCGGSNVYIDNKATAALYIYTPYQPNAAAMRNLYGTGDGCSAYGNRNFWRIFTDWFGSTQVSYTVSGPISDVYYAMGGSSGALGDALGFQYPTAGGGLTQAFQNGRIHWSPATGAHAVLTPLAGEYDSLAGESGPLGYPIGDRYSTWGNGWTQAFQNGRIHYSPTTGAHAVLAPISAAYDALLGESGALGYPTGDRYATWGNGWTQGFQNGRIHYSPTTGTHAVLAPISAAYDALLGESGALGYPTGDRYATAGSGWTQSFQNGRIHWTQATGAHAVIDSISTAYDALGGEAGVLGYPTGDRYPTPNSGWTQAFQNGRIHYSPTTGAHAVLAPISAPYDAMQGESGALGYPTGEQYATPSGGTAQHFENGVMIVAPGGTATLVLDAIGRFYAGLGGATSALGEPSGALQGSSASGFTQSFQNGRVLDGPDTTPHAVLGPMLVAYDAAGAQAGALGWPTSEQTVAASGTVFQRFENGYLVVTGAGARTVLGDLADGWQGLGAADGALGDPTGNRTAIPSGGWQQAFTGGTLLTTPGTGTSAVLGDIATAYAAAGGPTGPLGAPVGSRYATPSSGWTQAFQNGRIHYSPTTGAHAVLAPLSAAYDALMGESGVLGYPTGDRTATAGSGWAQTFQNGRLSWSATTGARTVLGQIATAYAALGGEAGSLGYPTGDRYPTPNNGWTQAFQNGRIHYSPTTGAHAVLAPISAAYDALTGESGALGYPTGERYATPNGGWTQAFQKGRIHYSPTTGAHAVLAPISGAYDALMGESGALGYPTGDRYPTPNNGWTQAFQNGRIHYSPTTGAHAVLAPISGAYDALMGESGALGYPTGDRYPTPNNGWTQAFQNGRIHYSPTTGAYAVLAPISAAYDSVRGESGVLGYPTGSVVTRADGSKVQQFEHGTITWTARGGAVVTTQ